MPATERCYLLSGAMAERRALVGQVSLYSFVWVQPIVSVAGVTAVCSDVNIRWGLLYNLYADRLLGFNMFPQSVYETREFSLCFVFRFKHGLDLKRSTAETKWYGTKLDNFGIRLDSR